MLSAPIGQKLSNSLNLAKNVDTSGCSMCGAMPIFGNAIVVFFKGNRLQCREDQYLETEDGSRCSHYVYPNEPEPGLLAPPYTAQATTNPGLDRCKEIEMMGEFDDIFIY